jgi:peptidoglycan/xylan/chitin deacetylase (PgdA/CDA1 family)
MTHPQLRNVNRRQIINEISKSRSIIEDHLGRPIRAFSYPYAFPEHDVVFVADLRKILQQSGYSHGVSTILGTADNSDDRFFLKRLPVSARDDLRLFKAKLEGAYDWLHFFQYAAKRLRVQVRS